MFSARSEYERFVEAQRELPLAEIVQNLKSERARQLNLHRQHDRQEKATYFALLRNILALLQTDSRPVGMSKWDLQLVRPFCEMLVMKGWPIRLMKPFAE
jgi:hypothetical protein